MLCIYGCFLKNGGFPQSPPQVLIIFSRKTHGPVGENPPILPEILQRLGQCHKLTTLRLDFFTLASMQPAYTPYVCLAKLSHGKMPAGRYLGRWAPQTHSPPRIRCSGMNRNINCWWNFTSLTGIVRKGGFCGWDLFDKSFLGVSTRNGWNGWMKKDEKGKVSKW